MPIDDPLAAAYGALRKLAAARLSAERVGHTLTATALVHDVYLRLASADPDRWADSAHFFKAAAEAMRLVLVDHARARKAAKRGGRRDRLPLSAVMDVATVADSADPDQVLELDAAVRQFEALSPDAGAVVRLRFYAGLNVEGTARALGLSPATIKRKWTYARAWLFNALQDGGPD